MRDLTEEEKAIALINESTDKINIISYLNDLEFRRKIFDTILVQHLDDTDFLLSLNKIMKDFDRAKARLQKCL